jgi:hypothetical protein
MSESVDLRTTVQAIRRAQHPELDEAFLVAVIQAEEENPNDDVAAIAAIQLALRDLLKDQGS